MMARAFTATTVATLASLPALVAAHGAISTNSTLPSFITAWLPAHLLHGKEDGGDSRSVLAVCALSLAFLPLLLSILLPSNLPQRIEKMLVAFAAGSLLGDIFLHLLPHLLGNTHDHEHDHKHGHRHDHVETIPTSMKLLLGFVAFLFMEKVMSTLMDQGDNENDARHTHVNSEKHASLTASEKSRDNATSTSASSQTGAQLRQRKSARGEKAVQENNEIVHPNKQQSSTPAMKPSAYLHLLASSIHVFMDGLLLTLSFAHSPTTGLSTFLALVLHEVPHRLGDFTLMQTVMSCSRPQAVYSQVVLSFATFLGSTAGYTLPSTLIDSIMPYVGGGLVYVATVGVIPGLVGGGHSHSHGPPPSRDCAAPKQEQSNGHAHTHEHRSRSCMRAVVDLAMEMLALGGGVAIMMAVA